MIVDENPFPKVIFVEQDTAPPTPSDGQHSLYVKADGALYAKNDAGVERQIESSASSGATVRAATTANITIATALNNADTLDGVTLATGDLVLVKNQSSASENGVYVVGITPARSSDFDAWDDLPGTLLTVQEGTANADTVWLCTANGGGTLESTSVTFAAVGSGSVDGPVSSTDNAIVRFDGTGGATLQDSAITVSDAGALSLPDGVRQTFNPDGTNAGINVGSQAGDPSSLSNGDLWYNSSGNALKARINGSTVSLGSGGGLADGDYGDVTVSGSGTAIAIDNSAVTLAKIANASASSKLVGSGASGSGSAYTELTLGTNLSMSGTTLNASGGGSGAVVQVQNTQTGTSATGTTAIPIDNTIPQNTEGDQYMTLAITPTSSSNKLKIEVVFSGAPTTGSWVNVALFQDSTANALAAIPNYQNTNGASVVTTFTHYMTAGTTSATTFKVRAGTVGGVTLTFNGGSGTQFFGGVAASSITITEIVP